MSELSYQARQAILDLQVAARDVLDDHRERLKLYPDDEGQCHRRWVMWRLQQTLTAVNKEVGRPRKIHWGKRFSKLFEAWEKVNDRWEKLHESNGVR